jgi:DNA-binding transcriptional LysR family regulator
MDLSALRIFKAVAEEGSVTKAAARMHRVQSNVSARLAQLEENLGVPLFHRSGRRLVISAEGARLLAYADRLLQLADEAEAAVRNEGQPGGKLLLGSMETTAAARLPAILARYHQRYPQVEMLLDTGPTDYLLREVLEHRLDAALVAAPVNHAELARTPVFEEELQLLTAKPHAPVHHPGDVKKTTLLVFRSGCSYRKRLEQWLADGGITPARTLEFGTFEAILGCVAAGMGVAMMPRSIIEQRDLAATLQVHALPPQYARVETLLVWRSDISRHTARQAFAEELRST